jgi:ATP synthase protein I
MVQPSKLSRYLRFSSIGLELGGAVILGLVIGQWLDDGIPRWSEGKIHTSPWLTLLFLGFGMAAGFRSIFRLLKDLNTPPESGKKG